MKFVWIKKTACILLMLFFILSVTAASASAADTGTGSTNGYGYIAGYNKGFEDGKVQAKKDCEQYGSKDILSKIPSPPEQYGCAEYYKHNFNNGYEKGYVIGYNLVRYGCLK
jgi:hypothetical protein